MIVLLDTSVLARKLLGEPSPLAEWSAITEAYASRLVPLELGRLVDRLRLEGAIDDEDVASFRDEQRRVMSSIDLVPLTESLLEAAGGPMPTVIGSMDAVHLVTALEVKRHRGPVTVATHDRQMSRAARALGLDVIGST